MGSFLDNKLVSESAGTGTLTYDLTNQKGPSLTGNQDGLPGYGGCSEQIPQRNNWTNKAEYILSMIGYAIGLGNIWKFPYIAYRNGGGVFLIPYLVMLVFCGIPLFAIETAMGQFCSQGAVNVWRAVPILQGVGLSTVMVALLVTIYYSAIVAFTLFYMCASFQSPLPWSRSSSNTSTVQSNTSAGLVADWSNSSSDVVSAPAQSLSEQYWDHEALRVSSGLSDTGSVVWHMALCLLLSHTIVAAILLKGIKTSGKIVYFTATFPYAVILGLLIRGVTLEGASDGIEFFIGSQSNWTKLREAEVWTDAAALTFFSVSTGIGGIFTIASYSNFNNNIFMDSVVVSVIADATSVLAGIAVFSILGHTAHVYRKPVAEVVKEGFGLAFIAYPEALTQLPISNLWSVLFFFMLFTIGVDSQFTLLEVVITSLCDAFPQLPKSRRPLVTVATCSLVFLLGLPFVTQAGIYWIILTDTFASSWVLLIIGLMEVIGFIYVYGGSRFAKDIEMMVGKRSFFFLLYWKACWYFISPCILVVVLIWSLMTFTAPSVGTVQFPSWGLTLGWCIVAFVLIWIPVVAIYKLIRVKGSLWKRVKVLCSPSEDWHPYLDIHRGERYSKDRCRQRTADLE